MKQVSSILCFCLLLSFLAVPVSAAQSCGDGITWEYENGTLTVTGEGRMYDFSDGAPWREYSAEITRVVLTGGITYIGANAFRDYDALAEVDFGDALYEIGSYAFASCDALTVIYLPQSFKVFGESCFMSCEKLSVIYSEGRFPSFRLNSLWDTYVTIYYPADRPWGKEYIDQLEEAFSYRIKFLASDGTDPYAPTEVTTVPTTVPETTEATTVPQTEPTTLPTQITTVPTQAATQATTAPATTPPQTTAPTIPPVQPQEAGRIPTVFWIALAALCLSLSVMLLAVLTLKSGRKGRYSR